ncbi:MAG TPA: hypothetical protein VMU00_07730 [Steroidobacteraceae bacterium]|nr:hypothetical protein [Steroidobacteraceae bacterium]
MTPRRYDLYLLTRQKVMLGLPIVLLALLPVVPLVLASGGVLPAPAGGRLPPGLPLVPAVILWALAALAAWAVASIPYQLTVTAGGLLEFRSLRGTESVPVAEVESVAPGRLRWLQWPAGVLALTHRRGEVQFIGQFTDQHVLLSELRRTNPAIRMLGC